jgi:hypothetical protein
VLLFFEGFLQKLNMHCAYTPCMLLALPIFLHLFDNSNGIL